MMEFLLSNVRILMNFFHRREKDKKEIAIHHHPNHGLFRSWTYKNERFRTCDLSEYLYKLQRVPNLLIILVLEKQLALIIITDRKCHRSRILVNQSTIQIQVIFCSICIFCYCTWSSVNLNSTVAQRRYLKSMAFFVAKDKI